MSPPSPPPTCCSATAPSPACPCESGARAGSTGGLLGVGWEGAAHCSSVCRHAEARSFYTYYLQTLSGVTRGSYRLNVTGSAINETRALQPAQADRSEPCSGVLGWCGEQEGVMHLWAGPHPQTPAPKSHIAFTYQPRSLQLALLGYKAKR